jgi:hypothetical protein
VSSEFVYRPVEIMSRSEIVEALESTDPKRVSGALYSAVRSIDDWKWVQEECLKRVGDVQVQVRWAAVMCLGDIAMIHKKLDSERVLAALEKAIEDPAIEDSARFSLSLVKQFAMRVM